MSLFCSGHNQYLPSSSFYTASIKAKESRCKQCNTHFRTDRRKRNPLAQIQHKLYFTEHKRGGCYPSIAFIKSIVDRYHAKSAIDGTIQEENLCVVRFYSDLPLSQYPWNAVLITTTQARHLPKTPGKRELAFPGDLQMEMEKQKQTVQ
jgi:hypothetical protein